MQSEKLQHFAGDDNAGHFFVGTQDKQLRTAISKVPAGASLFVSVNGLHLEQPSAKQEKVINQVGEQYYLLRTVLQDVTWICRSCIYSWQPVWILTVDPTASTLFASSWPP